AKTWGTHAPRVPYSARRRTLLCQIRIVRFVVLLLSILLLLCSPCVAADDPASTNISPASVSLPRYTVWQAIDLALRQNPGVLIAKKKIEEAAGGVIEARAGFLPYLGTWGNYEKFEDDYATLEGFSPDERSYIWNISLRLNETAYAGGAVRGKMSIAQLTRQ